MTTTAFSSLAALVGNYTGWIVPFLFTLTVIVFFHELGHFLRRAHGESSVKGELMVSGGKGEKISVQDAVKVFNGLHT